MPAMQTTARPEGFVDVMALADARNAWRNYDFVVTIEDPGCPDGLRTNADPHVVHVVLRFVDTAIAASTAARPSVGAMSSLLAAGRAARSSRLLIHCHQGQSRSPAAALAVVADRLGPGREDEAAATVIHRWPASACNAEVVALADRVLDRRGRLIDAWRRADAARPKLIIPSAGRPGIILPGT